LLPVKFIENLTLVITVTHSSSRPVRFLIPVYFFMKFAALCPSDRCEVLSVVIPYDILNRNVDYSLA